MSEKDLLDEFPEIWEQYFNKRDSVTRNKIVEYYMPLANSLSAHYFKSRIGGQADYNDYYHNAVVGLIQAIEKYKPNKLAKFSTYASYRIKGQILNSIPSLSEKNSHITYIVKRKKELLNSLAQFDEEEGTFRTELEDITNFTLNVTYSLLISECITNEKFEEKDEISAYTHFEIQDVITTIRKLLDLLPHKQKLILEYYYYYELNYLEIADIIGVTKGRVSQIHKESIEGLRALYKESLALNQLF